MVELRSRTPRSDCDGISIADVVNRDHGCRDPIVVESRLRIRRRSRSRFRCEFTIAPWIRNRDSAANHPHRRLAVAKFLCVSVGPACNGKIHLFQAAQVGI